MVLLFHKGSDEVKSFVSSILDNSVNELPAVRKAELELLVTLSLYYADASLGCWLFSTYAAQAKSRTSVLFSEPQYQFFMAKLCNQAANSSAGRICMRDHCMNIVILNIIRSNDAPLEARVAAASAFTKLHIASKDMPLISSELTDILNLLSKGLQDWIGASQTLGSTLMHRRTLSESCVEIISFLVTRTAFKNELMFGSSRCIACVPFLLEVMDQRAERRTIGMSTNINRRNSISALCGKTLYGVAFSMASLTLNNEEMKADALQEGGIAVDEYENIQRILRMQQKQVRLTLHDTLVNLVDNTVKYCFFLSASTDSNRRRLGHCRLCTRCRETHSRTSPAKCYRNHTQTSITHGNK